MKTTLLQKDTTHTAFVQLNIQACTACWKCIDTCHGKVIDKSFLYIAENLINKHVLMYDASECSGCLKCIDTCKSNAISIIE